MMQIQTRMIGALVLLAGCLGVMMGTAAAQVNDPVQLEVWLRDSFGAPVSGARVRLQRLPQETFVSPVCVTDTAGRCRWSVGRGLYQALFDRPLDPVTAVAVAEGGLRGFGLTVGERDVIYHFTFHQDGGVYFDAAPEALRPSPVIPAADGLQGGVAPTPALPLAASTVAPATPPATPPPTVAAPTAGETAAGGSWRLLLFLCAGLTLGGALHLWSRRRQAAAPRELPRVEEPDA